MKKRIYLTIFWVLYIGSGVFFVFVLPWISNSPALVIFSQVIYLALVMIFGGPIIKYAAGLKIVKEGGPQEPEYFIIVFWISRTKKPRKLPFKNLQSALDNARDFFYNVEDCAKVIVYKNVPAGDKIGAEIIQEFSPGK